MDTLRLDVAQDATRQHIREQLFGLLDDAQVADIVTSLAPLAESGGHCHDVGEVYAVIAAQELPSAVRDNACAVYRILAEAEAQVHGCPVEHTHFHEVGNHEAIANVLAVCLALQALAPGRIVAPPVQAGKGKVRCAHGLLDVPAPATAAIIARGISVNPLQREGEWLTPTSAALILHFADAYE